MMKKKKKDKPMTMAERWAYDEEHHMDNLFGLEPQDGPFTLYYDDGQKRLDAECDDGKPIGKWTYYTQYPAGTCSCQGWI